MTLVNDLLVEQGKLRNALDDAKRSWKDSVGNSFFNNKTGDFEGAFTSCCSSLESLLGELESAVRDLNQLDGSGGSGGSGFDIPQNFRQHTR